jgi:hypothetical protein
MAVLWYEVVLAAVTDRGVVYTYPGTVRHGVGAGLDDPPEDQLRRALRVLSPGRLAGASMTYDQWRQRISWHGEPTPEGEEQLLYWSFQIRAFHPLSDRNREWSLCGRQLGSDPPHPGPIKRKYVCRSCLRSNRPAWPILS